MDTDMRRRPKQSTEEEKNALLSPTRTHDDEDDAMTTNNPTGSTNKNAGIFASTRTFISRSILPLIKRSIPTTPKSIILTIFMTSLLLLGFMQMLDYMFSSYGISKMNLIKLEREIKTISKTTSYAVVINTYKRPDRLKLALNHYAQTCGQAYGVGQVFVVWAELDVEPPKPEDILFDSIKSSTTTKNNKRNIRSTTNKKSDTQEILSKMDSTVEFIRVPKDSLNSRFLPIDNLDSNIDAVFMVDDDLQVDCTDLYQGFEAWRFHSNAMVGYYPRLASPPRKPLPTTGTTTTATATTATDTIKSSSSSDSSSSSSPSLIYHTWPIVYAQSQFNIILTKASFLHKKYMDIYSDPKRHPVEILDYVDEHMNCEDIAMAMLIANITKSSALSSLRQIQELEQDMKKKKKKDGNNEDKVEQLYCNSCPIYIEGHVKDTGLLGGISTSNGGGASGHMPKRSMCLDVMEKIYTKHGWEYPLFDVDLKEQSWSHHYPGFNWQTKPSNFFEWFSVGNTFV